MSTSAFLWAQVLVARRRSATQSVQDLGGQRVMLEPQSEELLAYLNSEGISSTQLQLKKHSFDVNDLIAGRTDAISAYLTTEPYFLEQADFPYQIYTPRSDGIDVYGDNLFTSEQQIRAHPERVAAFRAASLRGWEYAAAHPDQMISLILQSYPNLHDTPGRKDFLQFEAAQTLALLRHDLIAPGYMNPGRWRHIAEAYASLGMLPKNFPLEGFLYHQETLTERLIEYRKVAGLSLLVFLALCLLLYILRVNRRLAHSLSAGKKDQLRLQLLSMAIEHSPTSVVITAADTRIEYVNPQFCKETGYSAEEAIGRTPKMLQSGLTEIATYQDMWACLAQGKVWSGELINRRKSGEIYWEEAHIAAIRDEHGQVIKYISVKLDVTERKEASDRMAHMAHHDGLTNLPNRILFFDRFAQALITAKINDSMLALMFIDLDRFKPINDNHGHAIGDAILQQVAVRMKRAVRDNDTVGRIGGDEFVALITDVGSSATALMLADKIRHAVGQPFVIENCSYHISVSIGIALYPEHGHEAAMLAQHADHAMYLAKANGRDHARMFVATNRAPSAAEGS
ncbi:MULTISPECIES: diguanylate cyclase domain-containing protein [unclassified Undibacterium]|uniref:diguanylate cyclase domain-containing protein n=2 Tax=Pseudomonadota TaxID=1224 RepID=UPI002AC92C44|nr:MULTISPECIES: diguanylate cyclase [unclassified Undibacterium]MEB0137589.1 diguanylate cyclase [Undibacterium sp. CCC2.1]MEB0170590.1 diguanylate cyclase [Undibacterium sp. CCC1.1]MEB0174531.1 diguanylate cyclase [Undibacterium sp. CCC3.4]MEB0213672.1 diguanylate cyclase [Undibacterium sp. 5I2]WPX43838.1 diguanylate cyclase [Undibacterium sp. CCC3.4]